MFTELLVDASGLVVGLGRAGSKVEGFERDANRSLGRLDKAFASSFAGIARSAGSLALSFGKGALGGAIAGLGGTALLGTLRNTARSLADIGDKAKQAGLDTEKLQELGAVAAANRIEVDSLAAAMRELQIRGDAYVQSLGQSGAGADSFRRLGITVDELKSKLKDPTALLGEIVDRVQQLDRAGQMRVFGELFGRDGARFIRILDDGEEGIRRIVAEARAGGRIIDADLIKKAEILDRRFEAITTTVGNGLKSAIVAAAGALGDFVDAFNNFVNRVNAPAAGLGGNQSFFDLLSPDAKNALRLNVQLAGVRKPADLYKGFGLNPDGSLKVQAAIADAPKSPTSGSRSGTITETDRQAKATAELVQRLRDELAAIGASDVERRIMTELRAANVAGASVEGQTIRGLVEAIAAEEKAYGGLQDAIADASALTKDFVGSLLSDVRGGVPAVEALGNAFQRLGDRLIEMALDTAINSLFQNLLSAFAGGIGGGFGGLGNGIGGGASWAGVQAFGKGYSGGGYTGGGGRSDVAGIVHGQEFVVDADATAKNRSLLELMNSGVDVVSALLGGSAATRTQATAATPRLPAVGGASSLEVRIRNEGGNPVEAKSASMSRQGNVDIVDIVIGAFNTAVAQGKTDGAMSAYGLRRVARG